MCILSTACSVSNPFDHRAVAFCQLGDCSSCERRRCVKLCVCVWRQKIQHYRDEHVASAQHEQLQQFERRFEAFEALQEIWTFFATHLGLKEMNKINHKIKLSFLALCSELCSDDGLDWWREVDEIKFSEISPHRRRRRAVYWKLHWKYLARNCSQNQKAFELYWSLLPFFCQHLVSYDRS